MKILIVYPTKNQRKKDATGAFIPEALHFENRRRSLGDSVDAFTFDPNKFAKSDLPEFYNVIQKDSYDCVAIFSHGIATTLPQLHIGKASCKNFALALTSNLLFTQPLHVILYCCLTSLPLNGKNFADTLADELFKLGQSFKLWGHRTAGHTTRNPNVTLYEYTTSRVNVTQYPKALSDLAPRFKKRMADWNDEYRFDYPFELPDKMPGIVL